MKNLVIAAALALIANSAAADFRGSGSSSFRTGSNVDSKATLTWAIPTEKEDGTPLHISEIKNYQIQESVDGGEFNTIVTLSANTARYVRNIRYPKLGMVVTYRMLTTATYACGNIDPCVSKWSEEKSKTLRSLSAPKAPQGAIE